MGQNTESQLRRQNMVDRQNDMSGQTASRNIQNRNMQTVNKLSGDMSGRNLQSSDAQNRNLQSNNMPSKNMQRRERVNTSHHKKGAGRKNNTVKIILLIVLILQLVTVCELFALIKVLAAKEEYAAKMFGTEKEATVNASEEIGGEGKATGKSGEGLVEKNDWKLVLVNKWNAMETGYVPELSEVAEDHYLDSRIVDALQDMIAGARKAGYTIYIISAYRDMDKQTYLYQEEVKEWLAKGYSQSGAEREAAKVVAYPGTSEHHLGLAVDLVSDEHVALDEGAERTKGYQWLVSHCQKYGFILRYPNGATDITGIIYEPWHFRYVGKEAAEEIMERGITLEEYLEEQSTTDMSRTRGGEM